GSSHQPSQSRAIPTRTVAISDATQLPQDYCTLPGGRCSPPRREEQESLMTESFCWIVAILPWHRPHLAICPISLESPALAP
ncbi:Eukaryotic translation initiation factor 4E-binding protein 2, partial [Lemmus lemmus]